MEQAQNQTHDETSSIPPSALEPVEPDQNGRPASTTDVINDENKSSIDNKGDTPKVVEMIPKTMTGSAMDGQRRKRGILTEPHQLEGTVEKSPRKMLKTDEEDSPKTLKEKKERYLRKANEANAFTSRSYMKKENECKSMTELLADKKEETMSKSILELLERAKAVEDAKKTEEAQSKAEEDSDESQIPELVLSKDSNGTVPMKEFDLMPFVETHFAPCDTTNSTGTVDKQLLTDSLQEKINDEKEQTHNSTQQTQNTFEIVELQDNKAKTSGYASLEEKMNEDVELQQFSISTAPTKSPVKLKDEKDSVDDEIQETMAKKDDKPSGEHSNETSQQYSLLNVENRDSYLSRKSPDSSSGVDTDSSERDDNMQKKSSNNQENGGSGKKDQPSLEEDIESDKLFRDLTSLMNDVNNYSRAALAIVQAKPISVIPNVKFNVPTPLSVEPELPETLKLQYELLEVSHPSIPSSKKSSMVPTADSPCAEDEKQSSTAGQPVDDNGNSSNGTASECQLAEASLKTTSNSAQPIDNKNTKKKCTTRVLRLAKPMIINRNALEIPENKEYLPDCSNIDKVPDHDDEPVDLEILPDRRRRAGIIYPGIPPPPQNPAPAPVPERENTPDQNQEPTPEGESPPDSEAIPAPQPTPESQEEQTNSEQEGNSTSEQTKSEDSSSQSEEGDTSSSSGRSENEDMELKQDGTNSSQNILQPGDLTKHVRQCQSEIESKDVQKPDLNAIPSKKIGESPHPSYLVLADKLIETIIPPVIDSPDMPPEVPEAKNEDERKIESSEPQIAVEVDVCPVPAWPNVPDEEPEVVNPPPEPIPQDHQNGPGPFMAVDNKVSNIEKVGHVLSGNRRRTKSLNQPSSSRKFVPVYHPGTKNEYYDENLLSEVNEPKKTIQQSPVDQNDHMDVEMPFEVNSDESSMSSVNVPEAALPAPENIVEEIPSSQDEEITNLESVPDPESKVIAPKSETVPGMISCTQPPGPEDTTGQDSSESDKQKKTEAKSQNNNEAGPSSTTGTTKELGDGSGSKDDKDENAEKLKTNESDPQKEEKQPSEYLVYQREKGTKKLMFLGYLMPSALRFAEMSTSSGSTCSEPFTIPSITNPEAVDPLANLEYDESIIVLNNPEEEEEASPGNEPKPTSSTNKEEEAATSANVSAAVRPARITHRRLAVAEENESESSDIEMDHSESGISEVDGSSDRDATAGEVSEPVEDYAAARRLTRRQAANVSYHQLKQIPGLKIVAPGSREFCSTSPETEPPVSKPPLVMDNTYASSDSGSTLLPKDTASSTKESEKSLSSNSNEPAVQRQPPRLEDLDLPQDAEYQIEKLYCRRRPTSDPLVEILEIVPPPQSEKRKNSCPPEGAETKKIKTEVTEEGDQQQGSSGETNQSEDVNMADANAEEQVSDSDREVAAIMATPVPRDDSESENRTALDQTRRLSILMPQDNNGRTQVLLFPPRNRESSFVPYKPTKKPEDTTVKIETAESSKPSEEKATEKDNTEVKMETAESLEPSTEEAVEAPKEEPPKEEPAKEQTTTSNKRGSFGTRSGLRKRESLEPQKKNTPTSSPRDNKKGVETRAAATSKQPWKSGKTVAAPAPQSKPEPKRTSYGRLSGGGTCKEPANKKTPRDDKEDPDNSQGKTTGRRLTRSPVKKPLFRR